jgi:hypothetical protein
VLKQGTTAGQSGLHFSQYATDGVHDHIIILFHALCFIHAGRSSMMRNSARSRLSPLWNRLQLLDAPGLGKDGLKISATEAF